jgi:hypothetical protein
MRLRKHSLERVGHSASSVSGENHRIGVCAPLVCREFHAQPDLPHSCAGTEWTEADFGGARAADEPWGVKVEDVARRVKCAARRAKRL